MNPAGRLILWFSAFLVLWAVVVVDKGRGHDAGGWHYPAYCCHEADCAPVTKFGARGDEGVAQTKLHKEVSINPKLYTHKLASPDGKMHICATPDEGGPRKFYCIFSPEGM